MGARAHGLGSAHAAATGEAIANALLAATGQRAFSSVFVAVPNDIANDVAIVDSAPDAQSPVLVTNVPANGAITLPMLEAQYMWSAMTVYTIGKLTFGSLAGLPSGCPG